MPELQTQNQPQLMETRTKAFLKLLSEHDRRLSAFVLAMVRNNIEAEEIVQETRVRLWEQFDDYDTEKDFGVWARTIAYYQVLTYRRRLGREKSRYDKIFLDAIVEEVEKQSPELERRHLALQACLKKLDAGKRMILLRYYEGTESSRELAELANKPFEAFRKSIQRTRIALSKCVQKTLEAES